jgi:uncharacterized protein YndB with AHSA1/START domain
MADDGGMQVSSTHTYAASPDAVFTMMTDPDMLSAKYEALGHRDVRITEHRVDAGAVTVGSRRSVPMEVPGFAKRFLSPMNTVEQHDQWDAPAADHSRTGTWQVNASGVPVDVGGTLRITPGPKKHTTVVEITGDVTSSVPIVGGKLAGFVGGDVQRTLTAEEEFNDGYLAERGTTRGR